MIEAGAGVGAEVETGPRASRMVLKICCKSSLEYLGMLLAAVGALATGSFVAEGLAGWSDNLSADSGDREETEKATKGAIEGHLRW